MRGAPKGYTIFRDWLKGDQFHFFAGLVDGAPQEAKDAYQKFLEEAEKEAEERRKFEKENERRVARGELPLPEEKY
jgi:hypothetical protein